LSEANPAESRLGLRYQEIREPGGSRKLGFHCSNLLSTRVDVKTYRSDHAVVLLVSTTAPQETNKTDNYSNDNQKHWTCGQFFFTNKSEVAITNLGHSTNND